MGAPKRPLQPMPPCPVLGMALPPLRARAVTAIFAECDGVDDAARSFILLQSGSIATKVSSVFYSPGIRRALAVADSTAKRSDDKAGGRIAV